MLVLLMPALLLASCIKTETPEGNAALTVIHAVPGARELVMNFDNQRPEKWFSSAKRIGYAIGAFGNQFYAYSGQCHLMLFQYPDTSAHDQPLFDLDLSLPPGSIKSLFLTGAVDRPDTMLIEEHIPVYREGDSVTGIRFVNLSYGSTPISVNIKGQSNGSEVTSLPYKGITGFKRYSASQGDYTFEFRLASTGALIATYRTYGISIPGEQYDPNMWLYKNNTLAFAGLPGVTGALGPKIFLINNF